MVERHNLQRKVGDALKDIFAERESELSLGCPFYPHHFVTLHDLGLKDVDYAVVLLMDALDVLLGLALHCILIPFLVGEAE